MLFELKLTFSRIFVMGQAAPIYGKVNRKQFGELTFCYPENTPSTRIYELFLCPVGEMLSKSAAGPK